MISPDCPVIVKTVQRRSVKLGMICLCSKGTFERGVKE